ncbi:MAG: type IX secretion system sortase PorU [Tannerella sp.]|nr:type IX secretion system sortase PorU [Tannerella sp.]
MQKIRMMIRTGLTLLIGLLATGAIRADGSLYAARSVLSEGKWVKIRVDKTAIYRLTYSDLKKMGFPDPAKVSVHGYGGWMLEEDFSKPYIDDVPAIPVYRGADYLLFYGCGAVKWTYGTDPNASREGAQFFHENNPYSMYGYYFVTDATPVNDMATTPSADAGASLQITTFDDYRVHEKEEMSVNNSGRELFGESFESTLTQNFTFQTTGITADDGLITLRFISRGSGMGSSGTVSLSVDDQLLFDNGTIRQEGSDSEVYMYTKGVSLFRASAWTGEKKETTKVTINYSVAGHTNVRLDYLRLQMKRRLESYGEACTFFRSLAARGNVSRFTIQNATSGMAVFDVTDGLRTAQMETTLNGSELSFTIPADPSLREFALVDLSAAFPAPETVREVAVQNLHALPQTDMVIVAPAAFVSEAERLAHYHRTHTGLSVVVVTPEQVYNEFSSGTPDATAIRRMMKMFYDRRTSAADAPRFLLLFGDGSWDNRQLTAQWKTVNMENFIPTYQTRNSLNAASLVIEDYFAFLADNEGTMLHTSSILLGVGRFPVRTPEQAKAVVDKVIAYMDNKDAGNWKNNLCFVADDGSNADGYTTIHMSQSWQLTQSLEASHPEFLSNKIFFDAYRKSNTGGMAGYPDVEAAIAKQLKEGALLINYTGHGNDNSWSDEHVITDRFIRQATYPHLPLWITATCDFAPFDAFSTSAGENVFLNPKSGGIALFTTTRVAYTTTNFDINRELNKHLFDRVNGRRMTLGEVARETKQNYKNIDRARFILIGDPALTLSYPDDQIRLTEINGRALSNDTVTFKAMDRITIKGEVYDPNGRKDTAFNGSLAVTLMDSEQTITTLDNNRTGTPFEYTDYPNTLQKINDLVRNGEFSFSIIVPKDISYSNRSGKMSLYALNETTNTEAQGVFKQYLVGGTAVNTEGDTIGPEVRALYLNDSTFTDGGKVNNTPFFVALLWDQSGVNIGGSSVGHDVTLTVDNDPSMSYNLNAYVDALADGKGENIVRFPMPTMTSGRHTAEFKVWDVLNHSATRTFTFEVVNDLKPFITQLTAGPVPAREHVTFMLYHNRPESQISIVLQVYDLTGRLYWQHEESGASDLFKAYSVTWDLTNGNGTRLRPGIYLYRAAIRTGTSTEVTKTQRLIILGK